MKLSKMILVCGMIVLTATLHATEIAVVNMGDLIRLHPNTVHDKNKLEIQLKKYQKERDSLRDGLESMSKAFEEAAKKVDDPVLSEPNRAKARADAIKAQQELVQAERKAQETMMQYQQELQNMENAALEYTTSLIADVIKEHAEANKIDIVIDVQTIPYFKPSVEITDAILTKLGVDPKLRKQEPPKAPSTTAMQ